MVTRRFFRRSLILILGFFAMLFSVGCGSKFIVKSDPLQADVYVLDAKSQEKKPLGKTPLELPMEEVKKAVKNPPTSGEFITLQIEKAGFESQSYNIPVGKFTTMQTALDVKMKPAKKEDEKEDPKKQALLAKDIAKGLLNKIFLAQKFAMSAQYERAHIEIDQVVKEYPDFARALSMRASIYFAQKNYVDSLKWYEEALKNDSQMEDAIKMSAKVRVLLGAPVLGTAGSPAADGRLPAAAPPSTAPGGSK